MSLYIKIATKICSNMKFSFYTCLVFIAVVSCNSEVEQVKPKSDESKITIIANHEDPEGEFVVKKMIRHSILDEEYITLNHRDTLELDNDGRAFFMIGERNRVLDSVIVDRGDIVSINYTNDSLQITSVKGQLGSNLVWYNDFHNKVEESQEELLKPIVEIFDNLEELRKPLIITNDHEIIELRISHLYGINRKEYNQGKVNYDQKIHNLYVELVAFISNTQLDAGAKEILLSVLNNSTIDKFRRMGTTVQDWLYNEINAKTTTDCTVKQVINMSEFYLNYLTGKDFRKITSLDLLNTYEKTDKISCQDFKHEIQRICIQNIFSKSNTPSNAIALLDDYISDTGDSTFYSFIDNKFGLYQVQGNPDNVPKDLLVDVNDHQYEFDKLLKANNGKVILVDYWASWCAPCRKAMPNMKNLEEKYGADEFEVIYVSIDKHPNAWKRAAKDERLDNDKNYWSPNWGESEMRKNFNIQRIPRYILYNKSGSVAYANAPKPDAMGDIIDDLLTK